MASEYREAGLPYDSGATRVRRLAEAVTILKGLLAGRRVTFVGQHYRVTEHEMHPLSVQRPHPPLLIGGDGRRVLELAAKEADIIGLGGLRFRSGAPPPDVSGFKAQAVDERVQWLRAAAGDRFDQLELSALVQRVVVTEDRRQAAEEYTAQPAAQLAGLSPEDVLQSPYMFIGTVDQIAEQLQMHRERWGISYYITFEPAIDSLSPVVARLAGT
jgi:probable F420-dependent oxidoreductase